MPQNTPFVNDGFWSRVEVCSVPVLGQDDKYRSYWNTRPASERIHTLNPDWNNYFCVSLMDTPGVRRKANFVALHVLVVDDVGPKVDPGKALTLLGTPTYRLETSPGNEQWGYVLDPPVTDLARAEALINNTIKALMGDAPDPGMAGVTRLMRLPFGSNTKYSPAFRCRLTVVNRVRHDPADLERKLPTPVEVSSNPEPFDPFDAATNTTLVPGPASPGPNRRPVDPTLRAMRKLGLVLGNERRASQGSGWDVTCPWVHEHTPSTAADTGTMYFRGGGFKCWHGHCDKRSPEDVRHRINEMIEDMTGGLFGLEDCDPNRLDAVDPDTVPVSPLAPEPNNVREFWDRTVWIGPEDRFFDLVSGTTLSERAFNIRWTPVLRDELPDGKKKGQSMTPAQWYFSGPRRREIDVRVWCPGLPRVFQRTTGRGEVQTCLNQWVELSRPLRDSPW